MRKDSLLKLLAAVSVIVAVFFTFVAPLATSIRQGLDLQGGTHVVLEAEDTPEAQVNEDAMERVVRIMEKRVNELGLAEPIVQRQGDRRIDMACGAAAGKEHFHGRYLPKFSEKSKFP